MPQCLGESEVCLEDRLEVHKKLHVLWKSIGVFVADICVVALQNDFNQFVTKVIAFHSSSLSSNDRKSLKRRTKVSIDSRLSWEQPKGEKY